MPQARVFAEPWRLGDPPLAHENLRCAWHNTSLGMMCLHPQWDVISSYVRFNGRWPECDKLVKGLVEERQLRHERGGGGHRGGTFLEVGANIGACTLMLLLAGAQVTAIEPSPVNLYYLTSTLNAAYSLHPEWAGRATVYPLAAGERVTNSTVYIQPNNLGHSVVGHQDQSKYVGYSIDVVPLDHLLPRDARFDMMKIDVEGYECRVLQGAEALFRRGRVRRVSVEIFENGLAALGCSGQYLAGLLSLMRFRIALPLPNCVRDRYGCDIVVRRDDAPAPCAWRKATPHPIPNHRGELRLAKNLKGHDECV